MLKQFIGLKFIWCIRCYFFHSKYHNHTIEINLMTGKQKMHLCQWYTTCARKWRNAGSKIAIHSSFVSRLIHSRFLLQPIYYICLYRCKSWGYHSPIKHYFVLNYRLRIFAAMLAVIMKMVSSAFDSNAIYFVWMMYVTLHIFVNTQSTLVTLTWWATCGDLWQVDSIWAKVWVCATETSLRWLHTH